MDIYLKFSCVFSTDYRRFRGVEVNLPLPGIQLTPIPSHCLVSVPQQSENCLDEQIFGAGVRWVFHNSSEVLSVIKLNQL